MSTIDPAKVDPGYFVDCWLDDDGNHVWTSHNCAEGVVTTMLPWPRWFVVSDGHTVTPSFSCESCGKHQMLDLVTYAPKEQAVWRASQPKGT